MKRCLSVAGTDRVRIGPLQLDAGAKIQDVSADEPVVARRCKLEGSLAGGEGEVPLALAEMAGGFRDEDACQFVDHVAGGEGGFSPIQVEVCIGPVTGESIEPAENPFALCDSLFPTLLVADFPIRLRELARAFLEANADEVLCPLEDKRFRVATETGAEPLMILALLRLGKRYVPG